jgi:Tfp pilus assembly protein PilV
MEPFGNNEMENSMRAREKINQQKGFTLLETSVALVVMMVGGLGIAAVFSYAIRNNTGSGDRVAALAVAQQQMERLRNLPFDDAGLTATTTNPAAVTMTSAGRNYAVRTIITNTTGTVKTIAIQVTPQTNSNPWALNTVQIMAERSAFTLGAYSGGP